LPGSLKVCIASALGRAQGPDHTEAIVADRLLKYGFRISFATNCTLDIVEHFSRNFGIHIPTNTPRYGVLPAFVKAYPSFAPFFVWAAVQRAVRDERPDFLFCDGVPYRVKKSRNRPVTAVYFSEPTQLSRPGRAHATFNTPAHLGMYHILFGMIQDAISEFDYDILIANSKAGADFFEKTLRRKVHVLFSPVDTRRFAPGAKENLVTAVGILIPRKNFEVVIDGVALARTKPRLAIVGNVLPNMRAYLESLKSRARALGVEDRVSFHLNVSDSELRNIVSRSKVCVSAGVEYLSLAVLEQMSAGCVPIVSRSFVPWREILEQGRYGYGFDSAEEIAETIDMILDDTELYEKMGAAAMMRAKEFDIEKFGKQLVHILLHG